MPLMVNVCNAGTEVDAKLLTVKVVLVAIVRSVKLLAVNVPELVNVLMVDEVILLAVNTPPLLTVMVPLEVNDVKLLAFKVPLIVLFQKEYRSEIRHHLRR